jgi:hypothetical protein
VLDRKYKRDVRTYNYRTMFRFLIIGIDIGALPIAFSGPVSRSSHDGPPLSNHSYLDRVWTPNRGLVKAELYTTSRRAMINFIMVK